MTRRVLACAAALVLVAGLGARAGAPRRAHAEPALQGDAVALLPLDAERSLEIYGQPVASEIARALRAGDVAVVVVGPRMAVPERARLIIDGTIVPGNAGAVTISLRIRNALDGVVLDALSATAPGLGQIDGATAVLAGRVLPIVRHHLAAQHRTADDQARVVEVRRPPALDRPMLVALSDARRTTAPDPLLGALDGAVASWGRAHRRRIQKLDPAKLDARLAARTVASAGADLAIGFWILDYTPEAGKPPMARARVRVRISDARAVVFDRVVVTDTVVGDVGLGLQELAERVAREVLAILRPHLRRSVPWWR